MADIYKFNVRLESLQEIIWRDIEITSVSTVAKLGYSILAAFETTASHLFAIKFNEKRYEILFEVPENFEEIIDPVKTKLTKLKLNINNILHMEYDYGAGWKFIIELVEVTEMKKGTGTHYPYITDGRGKGIIEDISPYQLKEIIKTTDENGEIPKIQELFRDKEISWDYRAFDLKYTNYFFKDHIMRIREAYENPLY